MTIVRNSAPDGRVVILLLFPRRKYYKLMGLGSQGRAGTLLHPMKSSMCSQRSCVLHRALHRVCLQQSSLSCTKSCLRLMSLRSANAPEAKPSGSTNVSAANPDGSTDAPSRNANAASAKLGGSASTPLVESDRLVMQNLQSMRGTYVSIAYLSLCNAQSRLAMPIVLSNATIATGCHLCSPCRV